MTLVHGVPCRGAAATAALLLACAACASWPPPAAAAAAAPEPELAGGWSQAPEGPAAKEGRPRLLVAGRGGGRIVVWATDPVYEGAGDVTVDVLSGSGGRRRSVVPRSSFVDAARTRAGDLDLLVSQGAPRPLERAGRLVLYRVLRRGGVRRIWTGGTAWDRGAAIARSGSRVAVVWLAHVPSRRHPLGRQLLRLAISDHGRRFTPAREVRGVLPAWLGTDEPSHVSSLGLALDGGGSPIVALAAWHRPRGVLVVASLTRTGGVRTRRVSPDVEGLVTVRATPGGRIGVLAYDTGIEGDQGECVGEDEVRRVWVAVREPETAAFGSARRLDAPPQVCSAAGARLVDGPGGRLAVLWGTAQDFPGAGGVFEGPTIRLAQAPPGERFGAVTTLARDVSLRSAGFDAAGALVVAMTRPTSLSEAYGGPLLVQRGTSEPITLDAAGAGVVLSDTGPDGRPVVAWQAAGGGLRVATGAATAP